MNAESSTPGLEVYHAAFEGDAGVGIFVRYPADQEFAWLSWAETVALHKWLSDLVEAANAQ